jgi:glucose/arabinose dehydrogenase
MIRTFCIAVAALLSAIIATPASAQGRGGIPVPALPDQPWEYQTATAKIRVRVLTAGLENPWSLEFLPDASILITERNGRLRLFKDGKLSGPVPGLPDVVSDNFISGLHDVKLHPDFREEPARLLGLQQGRRSRSSTRSSSTRSSCAGGWRSRRRRSGSGRRGVAAAEAAARER